MVYLFISDLHLTKNSKRKNIAFINFLKLWVNKVTELYILGDLFDAWLGDDDADEEILKIKIALNDFTLLTPIYFIRGNHDFLVGKRFAKETGVILLKDTHILKINNKKILLTHGDIFCTLDIKYQRLRKILFSKVTYFISRFLSLKVRKKIARKIMSKSKSIERVYSVEQNINQYDLLSYASKKNIDFIIHGHEHNPRQNKIINRDKLVTIACIPDWYNHNIGGYLILEDNIIKIVVPEK